MNRDDTSSVDCTIVIPVYFNEGSIESTLNAIKTKVIGENPARSFEVVFVDDGSGDGSLGILMELWKDDPALVRVVRLTRNFGQRSALLAGFSIARGKCVVPISADGQDPVELINEMLDAHFHEEYEIVICCRKSREESMYRVITSNLFYRLMRRLSFPSMPHGGFDYVLLGRRASSMLLRTQEAHAFFQGQILSLGYKTKFIEYRRRARDHGTSRWSFGKKLTYFIDGVTGYSFAPLRFMSLFGALVAILGFAYAVLVFVGRLVWGNPVQGWAPLMIVILLLGGFQMLMLGVMGEYVWRILAQVRRREPYIIEAVYDNRDQRDTSSRHDYRIHVSGKDGNNPEAATDS